MAPAHERPAGLIDLEQALDLDYRRANELFGKHLNPGLMRIYRALGLGDLDIVRAEGVELHLADGRTVLDFSGGIGVLGLGHNHPRILRAERLCQERRVADVIKVAPLKLQGVLAHNLAQMLPPPLEVSFFSVSGAEAVEAAMKICEKAQGPERRKFITADGSYHGKTHGALAVTTSGGFSSGFLFGIPAEHVVRIAFGDLGALDRALEQAGKEAIALIVEPLQGQSAIEAPPGYLQGAVERCRRHGVLTIFDEVKVGMGRTGTFCAFQAEDVVPDVVTLSKSLGGGKRAIGAMVSSRELFDRAYGRREDAALHTSTFSGLGSTCAVAIETLNVFHEERLPERARELGGYLKSRLIELSARHPGKIAELRGRGLMQGICFDFGRSAVDKLVDSAKLGVLKTVDSVLMASLLRELYRRHSILAHFFASDPAVLHLMPPLVVTREQIDVLIAALDDLLERGFARAVAAFVGGNVRDRLTGD